MPVVPERRQRIDRSAVRAGRGVQGRTWSTAAREANWALGRGLQVIPPHFPLCLLDAGSAYRYHYRVAPSYQALEREWSWHLRTSLAGASRYEVTVPHTGSPVEFSASHEVISSALPRVVEAISSQSSSVQELTFEIEPTDQQLYHMMTACVERPRAAIGTGSSELGVDPLLFRPGQPIRSDDFVNVRRAGTPADQCRRASHVQWAVPAEIGGVATTNFAAQIASGTWTSVFHDLVPILARRDRTADTTGSVRSDFYAWVSAGTGEIRVTAASSGASSGITFTNTSPAWVDSISVNVDCEDTDSADGRQTAGTPAWDGINVQIRNSGGTIYLASFSCFEE